MADPSGPLISVQDKKVLTGSRGMGVAPVYDDLIGVVPNRLLYVDHARRVLTLIVSSAEMEVKGAGFWTSQASSTNSGNKKKVG